MKWPVLTIAGCLLFVQGTVADEMSAKCSFPCGTYAYLPLVTVSQLRFHEYYLMDRYSADLWYCSTPSQKAIDAGHDGPGCRKLTPSNTIPQEPRASQPVFEIYSAKEAFFAEADVKTPIHATVRSFAILNSATGEILFCSDLSKKASDFPELSCLPVKGSG